MKIEFKYRRKALFEIRSLPGVQQWLEGEGRRMLDKANATLPEGVGYRMSSRQGSKRPSGRWAVRIWASSRHARHSNAANNTLVRVLGER